ncbi:MAG: PEGA domain-containing protein, partial [Acidobacteria bacterium]|nr:PEGA domain-containing protein [Acidobacteriota bacterium]
MANGLRLPGGTPVLLRLKAAISSSDAHVNDRVEFRVARDVRVGPATVIPKDSAAWAVVTEASPRGRMARAGKLSMNIQAACSADGQAVPLRLVARPDARVEQTGSESGLGDTLLAFPAWPVMLFLYGKDRHMPAGAEVTAYTDRDVTIDPLLMDSGGRPGTCGAAPRDAVPVTDASIAMVRSDPDGAEIQVDGKYVGNTPSRLRLTAGDHDIRVSAKGRHAWRRIITTTAGGEMKSAAV